MKRRAFMRTVAATALGVAGSGPVAAAAAPAAAPLPKRRLGKTGLDLSIVGFGGIVVRGGSAEAAARAVEDSLARGVNFFDTAASYGDSEAVLAPAIRAHRDGIILATKTRERTREGAAAEFARSKELLGTDHFDLFLVHGIQHVDRDVDPAFAPDGAMNFLVERQKAGEIRHLGFSAHSTEAALLALDRHPFDFFYFPVNYAAYHAGDFGPAVLAKARELGVPCVALKALARQRWPDDVPREARCSKCWYQPIEDPEEAALAMRWAWSQGVVSILPPGEEDLYRRALAIAGDLPPITPAETDRLRALAEGQRPLFPR